MIEINNKTLCESCFSVLQGEETCPCCGFNKAEFTPDVTVLPMGTKLNDKIVVGSVMGKGGFGITYLGYDLRMDKVIAIKEYCPNGISYRVHSGNELAVTDPKSAEIFEQGAQKFYSEAEMVSQFNGNPNIMGVYDYFRANNTVYLIMEYLSGITLKSYIKRHGRLSDGQALFLMDKIAAALVVTHSAGVLHRDISPDNIMLCADGKVKLIDFGAAREILSESASNLTVVMKPGYTPIEQYTKKGMQGAWTDIYSLGVSVYYALTGVVLDDPYSRMDSDEEMDGNKHSINESLWNILKKCTMINASDRYGSAVDLRKALRNVSAPLKAESITLGEDDLKKESEEPETNADTEEVTEAPDDIPATMLGDSSDIPEAIQKFESETTVPGASETDAPETDKDKKDKEIKPVGNRKKPLPFICAAAGVIIVAAICLIIGLNKNKPSVDTNSPGDSISTASAPASPNSTASVPSEQNSEYSDGDPEIKDGKMSIKLDDSYPGAGKYSSGIPQSALEQFDSDVKITLDIEQYNEVIDNNTGQYQWYIHVIDNHDELVAVNAYNQTTADEGGYFVAGEKFVFAVTKESIASLGGQMLRFRVHNLFVKSAVIEKYDPDELKPGSGAKYVELDSSYPGDFQLGAMIPKTELEAFGGDVRITLYTERAVVPTDGAVSWLDPRIITFYSDEPISASTIGDNLTRPSWQGGGFWVGLYDQDFSEVVPETITIVLPKSEIDKPGKGLAFKTYGFYITKAALEKAP